MARRPKSEQPEEESKEEQQIQKDVKNTKTIKGNARYMKLITGDEIFGIVVSSIINKDIATPHATYMVQFPLKLGNLVVDGENTIIFEPWISADILGSQSIPIKDDKILTHAAIPDHMKYSYMTYVSSMIEDEEREEAQLEATKQKHLH